jgi:Na+/H+-dicarboxylate symporter
VGAKALLYFEVLSTITLVVGLLVVNILKPGAGMKVDPATLDGKSISAYTSIAETQHAGAVDFIMNVVPRTIVGSFADGNVLRILFFAVLFGCALSKTRGTAGPHAAIEKTRETAPEPTLKSPR